MPKPASDIRLIDAFLDMVSAERGGADNTLEAYRRDLTDYSDFLAGRGGLRARILTNGLLQSLTSAQCAFGK